MKNKHEATNEESRTKNCVNCEAPLKYRMFEHGTHDLVERLICINPDCPEADQNQ